MKRLEGGAVFVFGLVKPVQNYRQHTWKMREPFSSKFYSQVHCEVLRKILGPEREQVMRASRKEQNSPLNITIKSKVMS